MIKYSMGKGPLERRERLHRVCKSIIDNPRNVDAGTVAAFKSAALRFVHTQYDDETEGLEALYHDKGELGSSLRKAVEVIDEAAGADIAKARDRGAGGHRSLTGALLEHLHDRLERRREAHGYTKSAKETPMSSLQDIAKTHGVAGVVQIAKNIVEEQKSFRITEEEFCKLIDTAARVAHPELGARAFEKVYEHNSVLARAIAVIKAGLAEELLSGGLPVLQVGGEDTRDLSDTSKAIEQLKELGARRWPTESASAQFERALTDPANHKLARLAVPIPRATTSYSFPR